MKLKHLLLTVLCAVVSVGAWAQTDVTSTYLVNPDFESGTITFDKTHGATAQTSRTGNTGWVYIPTGWTNACVIGNNAAQVATAEYGITTAVASGLNTTTPPATDNNGNTGACLGISAGWGDDAIIYQEKELPAGAYTLSWYTYNAHTNNNIAENFSGVKIGDKTIYSTLKSLATSAGWTKESVSFHLLQATTVRFQIGYTTSTGGSGNGAKLYVDNMKLEAIFSDVHSNLSNLDFSEGAIASGNIATYVKDGTPAQMQPVPEWFMNVANDDARAAGVATYGSDVSYGGTTYKIPSAGPTGTNGKALGFVGVWQGTVQYIKPIKFLAGSYDLTIPVYNQAGTTDFVKNLIGFVEADGTEHLLSTTSYTVGQWTTETVKLNFDNDTYGYLSVGYQGANCGSAAAQHLFVDAFKITGKSLLDGKKELANDNAVAATPLLSQKQYSGTKSALQTAIDNINNMSASITLVEVNGLIDALATAKTNAETSIADYALLNTNIAYAKAYTPAKIGATGYDEVVQTAEDAYNNGTVETCAATIKSLTDYKVADYDWAKETYTNEAVLGAWTNTFAEKDVSTEGYAAGTTYYNEWGNNTRSINQAVKLPAGDYILYGAGRGATNVQYAQLYYKIGTNDRVSVNYLMKGNTGLGIDTDGKANFSAEGTYTRENKGMGWEYRFIAFTLTEETDVEIGTEAKFTNTWVSVYAPKLFAADNAVQALRVIEIATALGENNANVPTGKMNAEVQSTLEAKVLAAENATASNTKEQLNTIYSELVDAISAANTSIANYAAVVPYNTKAEALDVAGQESYAETLAAYNNGTLDKDGEVAQAKAAYIAAVKAQTSENAVFTGALTNPSFEEGTGGWTNDRNTTGTYDYRTDGTNPAHGSKTLNVWAQQFNYSNVWQKQTLPAGYYTLSAKVRTNAEPLVEENRNTQVRTYVNNQKTSNSESLTTWRAGNDWNAADAWVTLTTEFMLTQETEVEMGIYSNGENLANNSSGWYQVDDFQLIRVCDVESANMTCAEGKYATFCAPFDVTLPGNVVAYSAALNDAKNEVTLTSTGATTVSAGTPVIIKATSNINETFYGVKETEGNSVTVGILTGMFTDSENVPMNSYVLQTNGGVQAFYKVNVEDYKFTPNRCYLTIPDGASARLSIVLDEEETGINDLGTENGVIADGKYMQNNKVVIVKNGRKYNVTGQLVK